MKTILNRIKKFIINFFDTTKNYYLYFFLAFLNLVIILLSWRLINDNPKIFSLFIFLLFLLFLIEIIVFLLTSQATIKQSIKKTKKETKKNLKFWGWLNQHLWDKKVDQFFLLLKKYKFILIFILLTFSIIIINQKFSTKPINQTNFLILGLATIIFAVISAFQQLANSKWKNIIKKTILIVLILIIAYLIIFLIVKYLFWLLSVVFITWLITFLISKLR